MIGVLRAVVLVLVGWTETLLPIRSEAAFDFRERLAAACLLAAGGDLADARQLLKLARYESSFREDVATCAVVGPEGELGPFQELPSWGTRDEVCGSLEGAARVAMRRVRDSRAVCRRLPPEERLAAYARGSCSSVEGRRLSRWRYTP